MKTHLKIKLVGSKQGRWCKSGGGVLLALMFAATGCRTYQVETSCDYPPPSIPCVPGDSGCATPGERGPGSSIVAGDTLELFVREDVSFNGRYPVRERGDIIIQSVGRIPLSGASIDQAAARIENALEQSQLHRATVIVDRVQRFQPRLTGRQTVRNRGLAAQRPMLTVYMTGELNRPGQHRIPLPPKGSLGVYEAILITGGASKFADYQKVHVVRTDCNGTRHCIPVDVDAIRSCCCDDFPIGDGDMVEIPERVFGF